MDLVNTLVNALVVGAVGLVLARMVTGIRSEVTALRVEFKAELAALRAELKHEIGELRSEMAVMRSDLTRVALAVGPHGRTGSD